MVVKRNRELASALWGALANESEKKRNKAVMRVGLPRFDTTGRDGY